MLDKYDLTKEKNISLAEYMLVFIIYNSAKLEGININYQDTKTILDGANVPSLRLDKINCILNLRDAWNFVLSNIDEAITIDFICKINSFVSRNESLEWGVLRTGKVGINGVDYIPDIPNEAKIIADIKNITMEKPKISFVRNFISDTSHNFLCSTSRKYPIPPVMQYFPVMLQNRYPAYCTEYLFHIISHSSVFFQRHQPLTAPATIPSTIFLLKNRKRISIGMVMISTSANSRL